jgi:hypothetical protein
VGCVVPLAVVGIAALWRGWWPITILAWAVGLYALNQWGLIKWETLRAKRQANRTSDPDER